MHKTVLLGVLAAAGMIGCPLGSGVAAADPPSVDPAPAEVVDAPLPAPDPFSAISEQTKADPVATLTDLLTGAGGSPGVLGQGESPSGSPPVNPLASIESLFPQNYRMPSGEADSPYVLQTGVPAGPFARVDAFKGAHALIHGSLGRMPGDELGQPLPGTAPPPGTSIPPGIEHFLPDPDVPVEPGLPLGLPEN